MDVSLSELWELVLDREAWRAAIHEVTKNLTQLSDWTDWTKLMGLDAKILVFWKLSFKPAFSLSFTFIKRLFSSSLSTIRVVSSAYLRLLIFLPAVLYQRPWIWCPRDPKLQEACMLLITEFVLLRAGWYFQCYIPRTGRWQRGGGCIWGTGDNCASVSIYSMWSLWRWGMKLRVSREGKRLCPGPGMGPSGLCWGPSFPHFAGTELWGVQVLCTDPKWPSTSVLFILSYASFP